MNLHHVGAVESDGITTPNVLGVQLGDLDVLDDDVVGTGNDTETLALDHTAAALADEGLLGRNSDAKHTGIVVLDAGRRGIGLVVLASIVFVNGQLALGSSSPGGTART